jgi:hypothetical protein
VTTARPRPARKPAPVVLKLFAVLALTGAWALEPALVVPDRAVAANASRLEREPTAEELARQQATVDRLKAQVQEKAAGVDGQRAALLAAAQLAGQALEQSATAVRALQQAQAREQATQRALAVATAAVERDRRAVGQWVRAAYQGGTPLSQNVMITTLLSARSGDDPISVDANLAVLRRIGRERERELAAVEGSRRRADAATDVAANASERAAAAAVTAARARDEAAQAVDEQRAVLAGAQDDLAAARDDVDAATRRRADLQARAWAGPTATGSGAGQDNRVTGPVGTCRGGDSVEQYPNGEIPGPALCPLRAAPAHHLRADAAYAFDRLSYAYAGRFGTLPCITDSYRSYAQQVQVYRRKPGLAAVPGTSNHGWGTALDLCGGIQSFTSAQHAWMLLNAPLYGWFHPAWAEPDGSKPEPWHWEFGG